MCVINSSGRVTLWNDALERILDCPRERALGFPLVVAVSPLARTALPRAIGDAWKSQTPATLTHSGDGNANTGNDPEPGRSSGQFAWPEHIRRLLSASPHLGNANT